MTWALLAAQTTGAALSCTLRHPGLNPPPWPLSGTTAGRVLRPVGWQTGQRGEA